MIHIEKIRNMSWVDTIKSWHTPAKLIIHKIERLNEDGTSTVV